jgi:6-phosphogluconolactonase
VEIKIFPNMAETVQRLALDISANITKTLLDREYFYIALSGGQTPRMLYETLALSPHKETIPWQRLHLFWGDERCVPLDHPQSNYLSAKKYLIDHTPVPAENIHPINGGNDPELEAVRYAREIEEFLPAGSSGLPQFDLVLLGLGDDGHTASLFPTGQDFFPDTSSICQVAEHPLSRQKRVSLTLQIINGAAQVVFLVSGAKKAPVVAEIIGKKGEFATYPAAWVSPTPGQLTWYLDRDAAHNLS